MNTTPAQRPLSTAERKALALARLDASRTQLIQRLYPHSPDRHTGAGAASAGLGGLAASLLDTLMNRSQREGAVHTVWRTARVLVRRWWTRQPWHHSVDLVAHTLAEEVRPVVRRHPWAAMAAAAAVGGALMLSRPWVARTLRRQARQWRSQFGRMLWHQLGQAPVQIALAGALGAWLKGRARSPQPPPADHRPGNTQGDR